MASAPPRHTTLAAYGLFAAAAIAAYAPIVYDFSVNTWNNKPHYQHFPFVVLAAVLLFVRGLNQPIDEDPPGRFWAPVGAVLAWLLFLPALIIPSPLIGMASLILLLGAVGCAAARAWDRPFPLGAWLLLLLILPPPLGLDGRLIQTLQRQSSVLASYALDCLAIDHMMEGNALSVPDKTLFVDEACSGIVSAVSIVACAAMYGVWRRRGGPHTLMLMVLAAGWAMLLNVLRIVAIALAHVYQGWDWAEGVAHTLVGLSTFGLSLITLVATDWLLMAGLAEIGPRWSQLTAEPIGYGRSLVRWWDGLIASTDRPPLEHEPLGLAVRRAGGVAPPAVAAIAFAAVAALHLTQLGDRSTPEVDFPAAGRLVAALQDGVMPEEIDGRRLVAVEHQERTEASLFAQHSVTFLYESIEGDTYLVSCDFPYVAGWHELSVCYRGIGWELNDREVGVLDRGTPEAAVPQEYAGLDLTKPDGQAAYVAFCASFEDGSPIDAPDQTLSEFVVGAFTRRSQSMETRHSFQVQVMAERGLNVAETDREFAHQLLEEASRRCAALVAEVL